MAKVNIRYLSGAGTWRKGKGEISPQWATAVDNRRDKQIHSLVLSPVFPPTPPIHLKTWEEFLNLEVPVPLAVEGKDGMMICEEENVMPLSSSLLQAKETEQIAVNARENIWEEGKQKARARAAQLDTQYTGWALLTIAGALGIIVIIFGTLILMQRMGR